MRASHSDAVVYSKSDGVAHIILDRPRALNAYNMAMRNQLYQALTAVRDDPEVRVAVLKGRGRAFCAGADLTEFGTAPSQAIARQVRWERDVWGAFLEMPKLLVAAVHGYCLGSGLEMALLCDLRIAARDTVFGMPEVSLGMISAAGGTQTLPRTLGIPRAMEMLLTGRRLSTMEAWEMGLVTKVVHTDALEMETEAIARSLCALDQSAARAVKEAVWQGADRTLVDSLDLEARLALRVLTEGSLP